jgi:predicted permease
MIPDLRQALHRCRRAPFASAGVLLSASAVVGLVGTLVVFLHAITLGSMAVRDPDSVVALWRRIPGFQSRVLASRWEYSQWRVRNRSFTSLAAVKFRAFDLGTEQGFERIRGAEVAANLFSVLGARPTAGRLFSDEMTPETERVVVLGEGFWRRRFGADPRVVGQYVRLSDGRATLFRVLGVVTAMPLLRSESSPEDVYTILPDQRDLVVSRADSSYWVYARLRPDATLRAVTDDMTSLTAEMDAEAKDGLPIRVVATTLRDAVVAPVRPLLIVLAVIAGLMIVAGCAYIANLRFALLWARSEEIKTRLALGGDRWQVARSFVIEGLGLVAGGGIVGIVLGLIGVRTISHTMPAPLAWLGDLRPLSLLGTVAVGVLAILSIAACGPALRVVTVFGRSRLATSPPGRRTRDWLLVVQLAVTLALLSWALVTAGSVWRLWRVDAGFDSTKVMVAEIYRPLDKSVVIDEDVRLRAVELSALPGVARVAWAADAPYSSNRSLARIEVPGSAAKVEAFVSVVGPGYFDVLGIGLLRGRTFDTAAASHPNDAIVSLAAANRWFGGWSAIGRTLRWSGQDYSIVGVVGDVREVGTIRDGVRVTGLEEVEVPYVYVSGPFPKEAWRSFLLVRSVGAGSAVMNTLRERLASTTRSAVQVYSLRERVLSTRSDSNIYAAVLGVVALLGTLLAAAAVYGLAKTLIDTRLKETAIRAALGASPNLICWTYQRELFRVSASAVVAGVVAGFWGESLLARLLFGAQGSGPLLIGSATVVLCLSVAVSSWVALWRASHLPPATLLRTDIR